MTQSGYRSPPPARPARPRHAASLVLLRGNKDNPDVLLGRRPMAARFMPGVYVFPGGALERGDHAVASTLDLRHDVEVRLARHGGPRRARALAVSRAREHHNFGFLVPIGTFATALAVALAFGLQTQAPLEPPALSSDFNEALFVYSPIDTHIAEELDFYAWLESRGNAG